MGICVLGSRARVWEFGLGEYGLGLGELIFRF